jgi:hypothetical protein
MGDIAVVETFNKRYVAERPVASVTLPNNTQQERWTHRIFVRDPLEPGQQ